MRGQHLDRLHIAKGANCFCSKIGKIVVRIRIYIAERQTFLELFIYLAFFIR